MSWRRLGTFVLLGSIALGSRAAHAQMSDGERKAAARAAYTEGVELQDKGRPADALTRFEAAEKLFDAPTHVLHIAECQALTGKLVEASETYETLIRKPLPAGSPDAFVQSQEQGKAELAVLRQRIPTLRVTVKPDQKQLSNLEIKLNDRQMPVELVGIARPVNPGAYKLSATATGYASQVIGIDVAEKEHKAVELPLQQGAAAPPAVVLPPPAGGAAAPPPPAYDQNKPRPVASGPSSTGLLLGARLGAWIPGGSVDKSKTFENFATAGPGFGLDLIGRVAKVLLLGGTFEFASLGGPSSGDAYPPGTTAEVKTNATYFGLLLGIMPNVDKVTFIGDLNVGRRTVSQSVTLTPGRLTGNQSYNGFEFGLSAGLAIPVGPIRIVPKAGFSFGQFSARDCGSNASTITGCGGTVETAGHSMLTVALGLYYHVDLAKKPGT